GLPAEKLPIVSVSIAEDEVRGIGAAKVKGQIVAWNYYQTTPGATNEKFVKAYKAAYGEERVTDDPIEAAYVQVKLWAAAVEKAGSTDVEKVKAASKGLELDAPEGKVTIDGENQHIYKTARIGVIQPDGLIKTVWESDGPIKPDPYLKSYDWAKGL
ncbi:MAG: transporter substrate-binding protein, partial [Solirubrobacterales bacterium]